MLRPVANALVMVSNVIDTFIDFSVLPVQINKPYGAIDNERYRAGGVFNLASALTAYAVTGGVVLVQPQNGTGKANLILKPFHVKYAGISNVKYFIYRGLWLDDFLTGSNLAGSNASELLGTIWSDYNEGNTSGSPSPKRIGFDLFSAPDTYDLDTAFFESRPDPDNENAPIVLATVQQGQTIGRFASGDISFDIVLEDRNSMLTLGDVRGPENLIIAGLPSSTEYGALSIEEKSTRAKILAFIDPAAYYSFYGEVGFSIKNVGQVIARASVLNKFLTKNTSYLDIRNEYGYSLSYANDNQGVLNEVDYGNHFSIGIDASPGPEKYYLNLWPIYTINETAGNPDITVNLSFWRVYIPVPVIYIEHAPPGQAQYPLQRFWVDPAQDTLTHRYQKGITVVSSPWSAVFLYKIPVEGGQSLVSYMKIYNNRRYVPDDIPATAFKRDHYLDNVLGPVSNINELLRISTDKLLQWHTGLGKRDINVRANGEDNVMQSNDSIAEYMVETGVSISNDRIQFYAKVIAYNYLYSSISQNGIFDLNSSVPSAGASSAEAMYEMKNPEGDFKGRINTKDNYIYEVIPGYQPLPINILVLSRQGTDSAIEFSVLFSRDEYVNSIYPVAATFSEEYHNVFLNLDDLNQELMEGTSGKPDIYIDQCFVKLSGYDNSGIYQVRNPLGSGIIRVFSRDGLNFTSVNSLIQSIGYPLVEATPGGLIGIDDFISYVETVETRFSIRDEDQNNPGTITRVHNTATRIRVHSYGVSNRFTSKETSNILKGRYKRLSLERAVVEAPYTEIYGKFRNLNKYDFINYVDNWPYIYNQLTSRVDENLIRDNPSPYLRVPDPNDSSDTQSVDMGQILYGLESLITPTVTVRNTYKSYHQFHIYDPYDLTGIVANIATPIANVFTENPNVVDPKTTGLIIVYNIPIHDNFLLNDFDNATLVYPDNKSEHEYFNNLKYIMIDKFLTDVKDNLIKEQGAAL